MMPKLPPPSVSAVAVVLCLSACAGTEHTEVTNILVSPEQQKADLERARDMGIISDEEFAQEVSEIGQ